MKPNFLITLRVFAIIVLSTIMIAGCKSKKTDAEIKTAVEAKLKSDPMTSMCMVDVKEGVVTLSGEMMNDSCKESCASMVKDVDGVKSVVNNCTVMPMTEPPTAKDEWLNKNITDITKEITTIKIGADSGIIHIAGNLTKKQWKEVKEAIDKLNPKGFDTLNLRIEK